MEPVSSACAGTNTLFRFGEYALRLMEVDDEAGVFIRMIDVVRDDLRETERLLSIKHIYARLTKSPPKLAWIKKSLDNTRLSLSDIGKWVERARVEEETKRNEIKTRVLWVVKDHEKVTTRTKQLLVCHQQLSSVLTCLASLEHTENEYYMEDALRSPPSDVYELPRPPPLIAPPAYEAVVSSSKKETGPSLTFSDAPLPYPDDSLFNNTAVSMPLAPLNLDFKTTAEVHDYRRPSGFSVAELEGDSWVSKTNDSGSINPYLPSERIGPSAELHREPGLALSSYNRRKDLNALHELAGSMPVERLSDTPALLPSNPQYEPGQILSPELHHDSGSYRLHLCRAPPRPSSPTLPKGITSPRFQFGRLFIKEPAVRYEGLAQAPDNSQKQNASSTMCNMNPPIPFPAPFANYQHLSPIPQRKPRQYRSSIDTSAFTPTLRPVSSFSSISSYDTLSSASYTPATLLPVQCDTPHDTKGSAIRQVGRPNSRMRSQKSYMNLLEGLNGPSHY